MDDERGELERRLIDHADRLGRIFVDPSPSGVLLREAAEVIGECRQMLLRIDAWLQNDDDDDDSAEEMLGVITGVLDILARLKGGPTGGDEGAAKA